MNVWTDRQGESRHPLSSVKNGVYAVAGPGYSGSCYNTFEEAWAVVQLNGVGDVYRRISGEELANKLIKVRIAGLAQPIR